MLVWTNDIHGLVWSNLTLDNSGSFSTMLANYGAWFWVHTAYSYLLIVLGTFLIIQSLFRTPQVYRGQTTALLIAVLAPFVGNVRYLSGSSLFPRLDPTPFTFTVTGLALGWSILRFRFLDIVPVARNAVIESMSDAVIVLDAQNRLADLNPAAQQLINTTLAAAIGQPVTKILSAQPKLVESYYLTQEAHDELVLGTEIAPLYFDLHISPLRDRHGSLTGRLIVLHDITERKQAEQALRRAHDELETRVAERTADLAKANESLLVEIAERKRMEQDERTRREELAALYDLSRILADAPPDDYAVILASITRHAVETIHVTFARIALLEQDKLCIRAAHPIRILDCDLSIGHCEPMTTHPYCRRVIEQNVPVVLCADNTAVDDNERNSLFLGIAKTMCLVPLRLGERDLGLLMFGEARHEEREPFTPEKMRLARSIGDQAASAIQRVELFLELEHSYLQAVLTLANAVDAKDTYTGDHAERLVQMALPIGRELGMTPLDLESLRYGAILHDIGKIGVPDAILNKPGKLDQEEWAQMRQHPIIGERILAPIARLKDAAQVVRHHHERYDGKGYPDDLAAEAIPLAARILTVVDSYSAIVDKRVYKDARSQAQAIAELKRNAGTQFDPHIVEIFLRLLDQSLVVS